MHIAVLVGAFCCWFDRLFAQLRCMMMADGCLPARSNVTAAQRWQLLENLYVKIYTLNIFRCFYACSANRLMCLLFASNKFMTI